MAGMTHEYSAFPNKLWQPRYFKDVDSKTAEITKQIKELQAQGLFDQAQQIAEQNKAILSGCTLDSEYINALDEEMINLEIYAKQKKQSIFIQATEPENVVSDDVWIGD